MTIPRFVRGGRIYTVAEAVTESLRITNRDGELEQMRERQERTEDAIGKICGFLADCWPNAPALEELLNEIVSYEFK